MKKTLFTATLLAASLMAASTVQAAPQEVTMWHYFDQKPEQEMLADMVEEYNSLQDDIHINATFVSRTELMNQYTVGALSGELPDIGQVDSPDMESYISLGVFEDITDDLESWGELDQFYDGPLSSCKDPDGKVYGLPQNSNCLALACNMDLLKAAGYDHMPQSLDEFKEMVAATTDASNDVYGFAMCAVSTEEGTFQILPWLRSVQNGTGVNVDNITADSAVNGLQTLGDFVAKAKKNYYDKGVKVFWLDEAEPEYTVYDFENYRYHLGPDIQVGNIYPVMYAKTFFDGMKAEGQENIINLLRCAWAGSQKYGALVWSGDIKSSFPSMKNQVAAGLNMGIAGIPWWTTDIGGFFGANINDPEFHELLVRWFEYGCFCPVMRLHGYRWPLQPQYGTTGGATCVSGAPNEVWSYTDQVCEILSDYLRLRERMLPYITELMEEAHEKGTPVMRPLFYDFPEDKESWNVETEYMFGPKVLVKPITDADARETDVYLPGGASWTNAWTGETFEGGQKVHVAAPIEQIPLFTRDGYKLPMK